MATRARTLDAVLSALGDTLALESELGTRAVEFDRALLLPVSYAKEAEIPVKEPETASKEPKAYANEPAAVEQRQEPKQSEAAKGVLYAFLVFKPLSADGSTLLSKMIAAMKLSEGEWTVECLSSCGGALPKAKVYIMLGSDTQKALLPRIPACRGRWVEVAGVPAISTMSPDFMLRYHGNDPVQLKKDKMIVWTDLKVALARLGRAPARQ